MPFFNMLSKLAQALFVIMLTTLPGTAEQQAIEHGTSFSRIYQAQQTSALDRLPQIVTTSGANVTIVWDNTTILIDPTGSQIQYAAYGSPDIVVLTRAHPDHLSVRTMIGMLRRNTVVLAPQAVINELPLMISNNVITPFEIGAVQRVDGLEFTATAAVSENSDQTDIGVIIGNDNTRMYISGYTGATTQMAGLRNINAAVISLAEGTDLREMARAAAKISPDLLVVNAYGNDNRKLRDFRTEMKNLNKSIKVQASESF